MNKSLDDEIYKIEFRRTVEMFRRFYPSDINKMLVDLRPARVVVVAGCYSALLRSGKIKRSGNSKPLKKGGIEWEYLTGQSMMS